MRTLGLLVCAIVISTLFTAMAQEGIWEDSLPLDSVKGAFLPLAGGTMTGSLVLESTLGLGTVVEFAVNDQTPDVSAAILYGRNGTNDVTLFDGGFEGQVIRVISRNTFNYDCTGTLLFCGGTDLATTNNDETQWTRETLGVWHLDWFRDYETATGPITFETLDANGDIGFGAGQVPEGDEAAPLASPTFTGVVTTDNIAVDGFLNFGSTAGVFAIDDTTPDISGHIIWHTNAGSTDKIEGFDGGVENDFIIVLSAQTQGYDCTGSSLSCGIVDFGDSAGDLTAWLYDGALWQLVFFREALAAAGHSPNVTYLALNVNGDIGFGSGQVPAGDLTAPLASPALSGNPTAPTATGGDNDTSVATTAFVQGELSSINGLLGSALTSTLYTIDTTDPSDKVEFCRDGGTECVDWDLTATNQVRMGSSTGVNSWYWGFADFDALGKVPHQFDTTSPSFGATSGSVGSTAVGGRWYLITSTSATDFTLTISQQMAIGDRFCVTRDAAGTGGIIIVPDALDSIRLDQGGVDGYDTLAAGEAIQNIVSRGDGDRICLMGIKANTIYTYDMVGDWKEATP